MCVATFKCSWFQRPFLSLSRFPRCFDRWGKFLCDDSIHSCALTEGARSYVIGDKLPCPSAAFQPYPNSFLFFKKFWHTEPISILRLSNPSTLSYIESLHWSQWMFLYLDFYPSAFFSTKFELKSSWYSKPIFILRLSNPSFSKLQKWLTLKP